MLINAGVPEWSKGSDLRSAALSLRGFESRPQYYILINYIKISL